MTDSTTEERLLAAGRAWRENNPDLVAKIREQVAAGEDPGLPDWLTGRGLPDWLIGGDAAEISEADGKPLRVAPVPVPGQGDQGLLGHAQPVVEAALALVREADGTEVVQLTRDNGREVWEWADSKPFYSPVPGGGTEVTGLTVFTPAGRVKAEFGDWITLDTLGRFGVRHQGVPDAA